MFETTRSALIYDQRDNRHKRISITISISIAKRLETVRQKLKEQGQRQVFNASAICTSALEQALTQAETELGI